MTSEDLVKAQDNIDCWILGATSRVVPKVRRWLDSVGETATCAFPELLVVTLRPLVRETALCALQRMEHDDRVSFHELAQVAQHLDAPADVRLAIVEALSAEAEEIPVRFLSGRNWKLVRVVNDYFECVSG